MRRQPYSRKLYTPHSIVMVGLVPTIHDFFVDCRACDYARKSWMPATSAGMTTV
jgi:hypothetical protein